MNPSRISDSQMAYRQNGNHGSDHRAASEVERDIERTRGAIDRTLDEIGNRLHPQHLLHQALDLFRSSEGESSEWGIELRRSGERLARKVKRNPLPALMVGAGAAWLWMQDETEARRREIRRQWDDLPEHSGSFVDARTGAPYDEDYGSREDAMRHGLSPAWHPNYDWSDSHDDETSWSARAESALQELRDALSDTGRSAKERLGMVAGKMVSLSGLRRSEIRRALHAQWDEIPEHSGSFVDARTGEPYDDSYGESWRQLAALHALSSTDTAGEGQAEAAQEEEGWQQRAEQTLQSIQQHLADSTASAKQRLSAIGAQLSGLAESSQHLASQYGQAGRRRMQSLSGSSKRSAQRMARQVSQRYESGRDFVTEAMDQNPLAMGAAVLGLGLLVGSLLPSTHAEDQAMGETADELKQRGMAAGREALEKGKQAATAAGQAALDEAEVQGVTPSQLAHQAREKVDQAADAMEQQPSLAGELRSKAEAIAHRAADAAKEVVQGEPEQQRHTNQQRHTAAAADTLPPMNAPPASSAMPGDVATSVKPSQPSDAPPPACDLPRPQSGR